MHHPNRLLLAFYYAICTRWTHFLLTQSKMATQPSQLKVQTALENKCTKQVRKVRPLVKVAPLLFAAPCTFILHY